MSDLTEKWKNGELKDGWYYILNQNNTIRIEQANIWIGRYKKPYVGFDDDNDIVKVIREVPTLEELQRLESDSLAKNEGVEIVAELKEENTSLKNQNKRLRDVIKTCMRYLDNQSVTDAWADNIKMDINDEMGDLGMEEIDV